MKPVVTAKIKKRTKAKQGFTKGGGWRGGQQRALADSESRVVVMSVKMHLPVISFLLQMSLSVLAILKKICRV